MDQDPWEVSGIDAKQRAHEFLCDADDRVTLNVYGKSIEADVAWTKEKNAAHATQSSRVLDSLLAMAEADAVVCDPHKMGYLPYPCGFVAYSDNRSRRCIQQEADYISALNSIEDGFNLPARYPKPPTETKQHNQHTRVVDTNSAGKPPPVHVEALMRSMLEGSRPGAVASSLWLHSNVISPTIEGHGHIVRASLLAARELYVWLSEWERLSTGRLQGAPFEFRIVTEGAPDTNVVVFTLQPKNDNTLKGMNDLTEAIYDKFSIKAELGAREYSYTKEFFVSRTLFKAAHYAPKTMKSFFGRSKCNILDSEEQYPIQGLQVIRAAVMSPYLFTHRRKEGQNLVREFVVALDAAARNYLA